jgi:hypothetical protein
VGSVRGGKRRDESRSARFFRHTEQIMPANDPPSLERRSFLRRMGAAACGAAALPLLRPLDALAESRSSHEFVFARLRYDSGDWDYNPKVAANVLDAVLQYTRIPVHSEEVVITADSEELQAFPFLFMTGHKLVRFNEREREGIVRYVRNGGFLFSDDCNHDVEGLYAKSFEAEMHRIFPGPGVLDKIPNEHPLYSSFFHYPDGPPQTSHELNGWGDNMVHPYMRGIENRGRLGVIYSNKDYGCEWDYDWRNKRFRAEDNTKFAVNIVVYAMT